MPAPILSIPGRNAYGGGRAATGGLRSHLASQGRPSVKSHQENRTLGRFCDSVPLEAGLLVTANRSEVFDLGIELNACHR